MLSRRTVTRLTLAVAAAALVAIPAVALAQLNGNFGLDELGSQTNLGNRPLIETIGAIINVALGFLGVVALLIVLYGGFLWLTSRGDAKKIDKAKRILIDGAIGLAIILASWAIAAFVINQLGEGTGAGGPGPGPGPGCPPNCPPGGASHLVLESFVPVGTSARNEMLIASFSQNLRCETVSTSTVVVERETSPGVWTNVSDQLHLRCYRRQITFRSATLCPAPLDTFQVPTNPYLCQDPPTPPITSCFIPAATEGGAPADICAAPASPLAQMSMCPGLSGCGCFTPGQYRVRFQGGDTPADEPYLRGTRAWGNTMDGDEARTVEVLNTLNTQAPYITNVVPVPDPANPNFARNVSVFVYFSRPIDPASVRVYNINPGPDGSQVSTPGDASLLVTADGSAANGTIAAMGADWVKWRSTDPCGASTPPGCGCLPANASIVVTVRGGANGVRGSNCTSLDTTDPNITGDVACAGNECTFGFPTNDQVDLVPPQLDRLGVYPPVGATNVDRALPASGWPGGQRRVVAPFNEPVFGVDATTFVMQNDLPPVGVNPWPPASTTRFGLLPGTAVLAANRTFAPTLWGWGGICGDDTGGIVDIYDNALVGPASWQFRTGWNVNGGAPIITRISPTSGPRGQCVTVEGFNLGCHNDAGDGAATGAWNGGTCQAATDAGYVTVSGTSGPIQIDPSDPELLSWNEVGRPPDCAYGACDAVCASPASTCDASCGTCSYAPNPSPGQCECPLPVGYSPQNEIILSVPSGAQPAGPASGAEVEVWPPYRP